MAGRVVVNVGAIDRVRRELRGKGRIAERMSRTTTTVGIHEDEGSKAHDSGEGTTVADIGFFHEMGTSRIPQRSWLVEGIAKNERAISEAFRRVSRAMIEEKIGVDRGYLQFGEFVVAKLQARIRAHIPPPLSDRTVERKGSSTPLIDEGRLIASISAKVQS